MLFDKGTPIIKITEKASARVQEIIKNASSEVIGLRIGIKTAGCSGLQYNIEFAKEQKAFEDFIKNTDPISEFKGTYSVVNVQTWN